MPKPGTVQGSFLLSSSNARTFNLVKMLGFVSNIVRAVVKALTVHTPNFSSPIYAGRFYCYFRLH